MKYSIVIFLIGVSLLAAGCNKDKTTAEQTNQSPAQAEATVENTQTASNSATSTSSNPKPKTPSPSPTTTPTPTVKTYTMVEVSQANSKSKCWTVISGSVYDLTSFISMHPGGASKILPICGKDGTTAFNGQHGTQSSPMNMLAKLKIGVLAS